MIEHTNADRLRDRALAIVPDLARELAAEIVKRPESQHDSFRLQLSPVCFLDVAAPGWDQAGRLVLSACFPGYYGGHETRISVDSARPLPALAADIKRRVVPGAITFARQALASLRTRDVERHQLEERAAQLGAFVGDFHDGHGRDQDLTTEDDAFRVTKYQLADADCRRFRAHVAVSWPCLLLIARLVGEDQRLTREANARDEAEEAAPEAAAAADPAVA